MFFKISTVAAVAGSVLLLAGCTIREVHYQPAPAPVAVQSEIDVSSAPPAPIVEEVAVSPGPGFVWIGGDWAWNGRWVWERGRWDHRPRAGVVWVPHRYEYRNGRHVWARGHWR